MEAINEQAMIACELGNNILTDLLPNLKIGSDQIQQEDIGLGGRQGNCRQRTKSVPAPAKYMRNEGSLPKFHDDNNFYKPRFAKNQQNKNRKPFGDNSQFQPRHFQPKPKGRGLRKWPEAPRSSCELKFDNVEVPSESEWRKKMEYKEKVEAEAEQAAARKDMFQDATLDKGKENHGVADGLRTKPYNLRASGKLTPAAVAKVISPEKATSPKKATISPQKPGYLEVIPEAAYTEVDSTGIPDFETSVEALPTANDDLDNSVFKRPDNITICQLLYTNKNVCSSPVAGGNLTSKAKKLAEDMPNSPPSSTSTMSSVDMTTKLKELSELNSYGQATSKSILKPSGASVDNLEQYETLSSGNKVVRKMPQVVQTEKITTSDPLFEPIALSRGETHLYATSATTNHVHVFKGTEHQGVLKIGTTKHFDHVHAVHSVPVNDIASQVVVLDNMGYHIFEENGLYDKTVMQGKGHRHRGLSHTTIDGKICILTLEVHCEDRGTNIVAIDMDSYENEVVLSTKIQETVGKSDTLTTCRFLAVTQRNQVLVTSVKLNKVLLVDLHSGKTLKSISMIREPAGVVLHPKFCTIFVSSKFSRTVEVFNSAFEHLGTLLDDGKQAPIGLDMCGDDLYVANNQCRNLLKIQLLHRF